MSKTRKQYTVVVIGLTIGIAAFAVIDLPDEQRSPAREDNVDCGEVRIPKSRMRAELPDFPCTLSSDLNWQSRQTLL